MFFEKSIIRMGFLKREIAKIWASQHCKNAEKWKNNAVEYQLKWFQSIINSAKHTQFGKEHNFDEIKTIKDFQNKVQIQDYENIKPYIERIFEGESEVLWKGKPLYFAKTSGTTSGTKYIPISKESMPYHIKAAQSAIFHYINKKKNANFVDGKMIFIQGSPTLEKIQGINVGRLSGISAHYIPQYLQKNRLPSWQTNCIEDWETKIDKIVEETVNKDMTLISGIPPWLVMYFEKLNQKSGKKIGKLFPNFNLLMTGGVKYEPYQDKIIELIGREIDVVQTYPASEGFIAFQDDYKKDDLLLFVNHGIFYEFVPVEEMNKQTPNRLTLEEVELHKDYSLLLTTNAGLYSYQIGDTVRFTSKEPYRIIVSGRTKHYTSAFGEHVIAHEVEEALQEAVSLSDTIVEEFTLAPQVTPKQGLPYHEWFIEFKKEPSDINDFSKKLDSALRKRNSYYNDLISGNVLRPLVITKIQSNGFNNYMKAEGKLGGQNKLPRLSNDRKIAEKLENFIES